MDCANTIIFIHRFCIVYFITFLIVSKGLGEELYSCNFQYDDCNIIQQDNDQLNWDWTNTGSTNKETGPSAGYKYPGFIYMDTPYTRDVAKFNIGPLNYNGPVCLEFYYYMYGRDMPENALKYFIKNDAEGGTELYQWSASYEQGQRWIRHRETIYGMSQDMTIGWRAESGGTYSQVAVDSIRVTVGECGAVKLTLPYYCDLEESTLCDMTFYAEGKFNWTWNSGTTDTLNTGPTAAQAGTYYLFIESSSPRVQGDNALIETPEVEETGKLCVEFAAHMFGASVGHLEVVSSNKTDAWLTLSGNKGDEWIFSQVNVNVIAGEKIGFNAIRGSSYLGDIAIDSIVITEGRCSSDVYTCMFDEGEDDTCDLVQMNNDDFDWSWVSGGTPTEETGPPSAQSTPGYIFTEASGRSPGQYAKFNTPNLGHNGDICVEFWYHMYGADIPAEGLKLSTIDTSTGGGEQIHWSLGGDQGQAWIKHKQTIRGINRHTSVAFTATVGEQRSDIALDSIKIDNHECEDPPVPLPFSCEFEDADVCGMVQDQDKDEFDWIQTLQGTPTSNTGPTGARTGSGYIYIESSQPRVQGDVALLSTPVIDSNGTVCAKFYSHMYGDSVGYLTVESSNRSIPWMMLYGDQGNQWVLHQVTINLNQGERIVIEGIVGNGYHGDIGLDSLAIVEGECSDVLLECSFDKQEDDLCSLMQGTDDEFDWRWNSLGTPSEGTGPSASHTLPGYVYTKSEIQQPGDRAKLYTGALGHNGPVCLEYYYYMYGADMQVEDAMAVYLCHDSDCQDPQVVWSMGGDQGDTWKEFRITLTGFGPETGIGWRSRVGGVKSEIAIDTITISKDECSDQPVTIPWTCDFEVSDICGMVQSGADVFNWTRQMGPTPTSNTGPDQAQSGNYYMFIESSTPRVPDEFAVFRTPKLDASGPACIEFYAHLHGESVGSIEITSSNSTGKLLVLSGEQGTQWQLHNININLVEEERIAFRGIIGAGYHSDLAIDNISIQPGTCSSTNVLFTCHFDQSEDNTCDLVQQVDDQFDWSWNSYETPTSVSGPTEGHTAPGYIYTDSTPPRSSGELAKVNTGVLNHHGTACVEFWYYMYGVNLGINALQMYVKDASGAENVRWSKSGNQGQMWIQYKDTLRGLDREASIGWVARISGLASQVAMDTIQIVKGECDEVAVELPYSCNFEEVTMCGMTQSEADDFHWMRGAGATSTANTGPTSAQSGNYYMFIEASAPRNLNDYAIFRTPVISNSGDVCLTFYAHIFGDHVGDLVIMSTNHTSPPWETYSGNTGNQWVQRQITLNLLGDERVMFKGTIGDGFLGDIAMDNLVVAEGACSSDLFTCSFDAGENDVCGMIQHTDDDFDWSWMTAATPVTATGPTTAHTQIGYIYTNSGQHSTGNVARIRTGELGYNGPVCVQFWYYMYGEDISTNALEMYFYQISTGISSVIWSRNGNQGQEWLRYRQTINGLGADIGIGWLGRVGGVKSQVAIDTIIIAKEECSVLSTELPFECDFESAAVCGMNQQQADVFDWSRRQGYTPTSNTGPAQALSGAYYMFIETSVPRAVDEYAIFETPGFDRNGAACVEFYAHMYGQTVGQLLVLTSNKTAPWFSMSGNQGNQWMRYRVNIQLIPGEQVWFKGVCGSGYFGDIAIDHVTITEGACPISSDLFNCNFDGGENDLCNMIQQTNDQFDWTWTTLETPQENTGPRTTYTSPAYLFTSSSYPRIQGDVARLNTGPLNYYGSVCVEFWYVMYGSQIPDDALRLYVLDAGNNNAENVVWSKSGNQGTEWIRAQVTVSGVTSDISIGWMGKVGGQYSQLAIDSLRIVEGMCEVNGTTAGPPDPEATTTSTTSAAPVTTQQPPPTVNLPYHCGFETEELCEFTNKQNDNFDWIRFSGRTGTLNTGPNFAHGGEYYMFIESSSPQNIGEVALLEGPVVNATGAACIKFYYHMYGKDVGGLYLTSPVRAQPVGSKVGEQGNAWQLFQVQLSLMAGERFTFKGIIGDGYLGDVAIDDVYITEGVCTDSLFQCDFGSGENDFCDMDQQFNDGFDWSWASESSPRDTTGPSTPHTAPGFIFADSGPPQETGMGTKISTKPLRHNGPVCLEFWYYLYGSELPEDALQVYLRNEVEGGTEATIFRADGDHGQQWIQYKQTVHGISQDIKIGWRALIGGRNSHVAIDSIEITENECPLTTTEETSTAYINVTTETTGVNHTEPTTPTTTQACPACGPSTLPYFCSFEGSCGTKLRDNNPYNWILTRYETPSRNVGPDAASDGQYYVYLESDPPMLDTQASYVDFPTVYHYGVACLKFDYYLHGTSSDFLKVYSHYGGDQTPIFGKHGGQSITWEHVQIETFINKNENFTFHGSIQSGSTGNVAIDNIKILAGECLDEPTTTESSLVDPNSGVTYDPSLGDPLPFECGFEYDLCGMYQPGELELIDEFDWTRQAGDTRTTNTGPQGAKDGVWYVYIESDPPRTSGETAIVETPQINYKGLVCVRFDIHMLGRDIDSLMVLTPAKGLEDPWLVLEGEMGSSWVSRFVEVVIFFEKIQFKAVRGLGQFGDIALDNINITQGNCRGYTTSGTTPRTTPRRPVSGIEADLPFSCDFENEAVCEMYQPAIKDKQDGIDWLRQTGKSSSRDTGPLRAQSGSWYMYTESRIQRATTDDAIIETPVLRHFGVACVNVYVHMYGDDVRTLMVTTSTRGMMEPWEVLVGSQGNNWFQAKINLELEYDKVIFRAVRGMGEQGEIAIDNLKIREGKCSDPTTSRRPTITTTTTSGNTTKQNVTMVTPGVAASFPSDNTTYNALLGVFGVIIVLLVITAVVVVVYYRHIKKKKADVEPDVGDAPPPPIRPIVHPHLEARPGDSVSITASTAPLIPPSPQANHSTAAAQPNGNLPVSAAIQSRAMPVDGAVPMGGAMPVGAKSVGECIPEDGSVQGGGAMSGGGSRRSSQVSARPTSGRSGRPSSGKPAGRRKLSTFSTRVDILRDMPPPLPTNEPTPVEGTNYTRPIDSKWL